MATTWNPSDNGGGLTLSGGNLSATNPANSTWESVRSTNTPAKTTGKWHVEFTLTAIISGGWDFGLSDSTQTLSGNFAGQTTHSLGMAPESSNTFEIFQNNAALNTYSLAWAVSDVWAMEVDIGNSLVWFQDITKGSGWTNASNSTLTGNPGAGTGGTTFTASASSGIMLIFSGNDAAAAQTCTINPTTASGTISTGFTIWDALFVPPRRLARTYYLPVIMTR